MRKFKEGITIDSASERIVDRIAKNMIISPSMKMLMFQSTKASLTAMTEKYEDGPDTYINHYECQGCDVEWSSEWDCMCNDKCPECGSEIEPHESEQLN